MISTDVLVWFTGCCTSNYNSCYHKKYFANSRIKHLIIKRKKTSDSAANKRVIAVLLFIAYRWAGVGCVWLYDCVSCLAVCQGVKSLMAHSWIYQLPAEHHNHHHHPWEPCRLLMPQLVCLLFVFSIEIPPLAILLLLCNSFLSGFQFGKQL